MAIWTKTGTDIIVDARGNPIECDHCPCTSVSDLWVRVDWVEEYSCDIDPCSGDLMDEKVSGYTWHPVRECVYDRIHYVSAPIPQWDIVSRKTIETAMADCPSWNDHFVPGGYYALCRWSVGAINESPCWGDLNKLNRPTIIYLLGYSFVWTGTGYSLNYAIDTPSGIITPTCMFDPPLNCGDPDRPYSSNVRYRIGYIRYTEQLQAEFEFDFETHAPVAVSKRAALIAMATAYAPDFVTVYGVRPVASEWILNSIPEPSHVIRVFFKQNGDTNVNDGYIDTGERVDLGIQLLNPAPFQDATVISRIYTCDAGVAFQDQCNVVRNTAEALYRPSTVSCKSYLCDFGEDCRKPDCMLALDIGFPPCKDIDSSELEERIEAQLEELEGVPYPMECLTCVTTVKQCKIDFSLNGVRTACSGGPSGSICGTWVCDENFVDGTASGGCSDVCLKNSCSDGEPSVSGTVIPHIIYCSSLNGCRDGGIYHEYPAYSGSLSASWTFGHMEDTMQEDGSIKKEFKEGKDPVLQKCTHASVSISGSIAGRCWGYGYSAGTSVNRWLTFGTGGGCSIIVQADNGKLGSGTCTYTEESDCTTDGRGCDNRWHKGSTYTCSVSFSGECSNDELRSKINEYGGMDALYRSSFSVPEEYSDIFEALDQSLK